MSEDRDLYHFFSGWRQVVSVARNAQRRLDRALANEFSVFDQKLGILRSQTAENQLSNIFRFLLDPTAAHGQGHAFLDAFIRVTGLPGTYGVLKSVTRDFPTNEGRLIDIVATFEGQSPSAIGIENKPWYLDSDGPFDLPNQVRDYCVDLNRAFPEKWAFIYLSGAGLPRPDHSIPSEQWIKFANQHCCFCMSYSPEYEIAESVPRTGKVPSITEWLADCLTSCEAEPVKWFLRDLLCFVRIFGKHDAGGMTMTEQEVAEFVMADAEHLAIALNIRKVMESVPEMLIEEFLIIVATEIRKDLGDTSEWNVSLMNDTDPMKANADLLNVRHAAWPDVYVGLSPSVSQCRNIVAGVWSDPDKNALTSDQREALHRALMDDPYRLTRKADVWWTAWADLNDLGFLSDFGGSEFLELARKIRQNEAAENAFVIKLGGTLAKIARKVNEVLHPT